MKKIITLFVAVLVLAGAQAQTSKEEARDVILGKRKDNPSQKDERTIPGNRENTGEYGSRYPSGSREAEIDRINREYDYKIQSIRNNNALNSEEKERIIRDLNNQRARKIKQVNNEYKRNDGDNDNDDRYEKHNKGKHKGWKKGNGHKKNKHKGHDDDDD